MSFCAIRNLTDDWCFSQFIVNATLDSHLKDMGFIQSNSDPCIHHVDVEGDIFILGCMWTISFWLDVQTVEYIRGKLSRHKNLISRIWGSYIIF